MIVTILSCGVNWWAMHSRDIANPYCFTKGACWLNSTALMYGRRRRDCHIVVGQVRFNRTSGFNPEYVHRMTGKTYHTPGPKEFSGKTHVLFDRPARGERPDSYLVTLTESRNGVILCRKSRWKSEGVQPISISRRGERYEAMLLMSPTDWVQTSLGCWVISSDGRGLELKENCR